MLSFIERKEGFTDVNDSTGKNSGTFQLINNFLLQNNHMTMGDCPAGWLGAVSIDEMPTYEVAVSNSEYYYCVNKNKNLSKTEPDKAYYEIQLFFEFNLPVVGELFTFSVRGTTTVVQAPADDAVWARIK